MKRAKETGLNIAGKAPFDTKKPSFVTPKTFAKTITSVTPPIIKPKTTRKPKQPKPKPAESVATEFIPSFPIPSLDNLTKDQAIQLGDEYINWVKQQANYTGNPFESRDFNQNKKINDVIRKDLLERGKKAFNRKGFNINDYYEIADKSTNPNGLTKEQAERLAPIIEDAVYFMGGMVRPQKMTFIYDKPRAYADKSEINIGENIEEADESALRRVTFHEISHKFEQQKQTFLDNSAKYVLDKATGRQQKLSTMTGNYLYEDWEKAYPDHFIDPYVGKLYKEEKYYGTEVFSVANESFGSTQVFLFLEFRDDPDHLKYFIGSLLTSHNDNQSR